MFILVTYCKGYSRREDVGLNGGTQWFASVRSAPNSFHGCVRWLGLAINLRGPKSRHDQEKASGSATYECTLPITHISFCYGAMLQPAEMPLIVSGMWNDNAMAHYQTNGHITNGKLKTSPPRLPPLDLSLSTLANGGAILPAAFVESLATTQPNDRLRNSSDASSAHPVPTQHALASIDSNLRVYNNPHRRSSPARFPTTPSSSLALSPESSLSRSDAPKLQHRHTLEVPIPIRPAPAAPRTSREQQIPQSAASEDAYFGSARLSSPSTHRGHRSSFSFGRRASRSMGSDLHLEESTHDEESARIVEALRQKRAARRRKKDEEEDDKVLMGTKVDKGHVNYETAYNMLTGIRHTVSRLNAKLDRVLEDEDFDACQTFAFDV